jgi:hypothetical protein
MRHMEVVTPLPINMITTRPSLAKTTGYSLRNSPTKRYRKSKQYYHRGGKIYRITKTGLGWVVPKANRFQIILMSQDDVGHFAFDKTYELVSSKYWFRRMEQFIDNMRGAV